MENKMLINDIARDSCNLLLQWPSCICIGQWHYLLVRMKPAGLGAVSVTQCDLGAIANHERLTLCDGCQATLHT